MTHLDFRPLFRKFLSDICKKLHKIRFAEERQERLKRMEKCAKTQLHQVLHGGSTKCLFPHKISSLPLAVTPNPNQQPDRIVTGSDAVKSEMVSYFQQLYHRTPHPPQNKPWITTPSITQVAQCVSSDPFLWPQLLNHQTL